MDVQREKIMNDYESPATPSEPSECTKSIAPRAALFVDARASSVTAVYLITMLVLILVGCVPLDEDFDSSTTPPDEEQPILIEDDSCGGITFFGECDGSILRFCEDGVLQTRECSDSNLPTLECGLVSEDWGFDCTVPAGGVCALPDLDEVAHCGGGDESGCIQGGDGVWSCRPNAGSCSQDTFQQNCSGDVLHFACSDTGMLAGADCGEFGLTCEDGKCHGSGVGGECNELVSCADGLSCSPQGTCVSSSNPACTSSTQCLDGEVCEAGRCISDLGPDAECVEDADCADGEVCDAGICTPMPVETCTRPLPFFIELKNDQDVEYIRASGCTVIPGNLTISGAVTNLSGLSQIEGIEGDLSIVYTTDLRKLDGLNKLTRVGGQFIMQNNAVLSDLNALSNLTTVHENLAITGNPSLATLRGLDRMELIAGIVNIKVNDTLFSLEGLGSIGEPLSFDIADNPSLTTLGGLAFGSRVQGNLSIRNNDSLTSLGSLGSMSEIGGLNINSNEVLTSISLSGLQTLSGGLNVATNPNLTSISFPSLGSVGTNMSFQFNPNLPACLVDTLADRLRGLGWSGRLSNDNNDTQASCP